jgi:hypothetical protein
MNGRNDSLLYTGASSASFGSSKQQAIRKEISEEKIEKRVKLSPASELVMQELDKEIAALSVTDYKVIKAIIETGVPHALEIDMVSNGKTIEHLKAVKIRLQNILREAKS